VFVLVSRTETFGMVITEALARGVPVVTTAGGAAEDTLGTAPDGSVPGLLVPPGDAGALAAALNRWLTDAPLRARLAVSARARRDTLDRWDETARALAAVLAGLESQPSGS
jgi:glycosyltransferase involved in cell wall biosynthesis